MNLIHKNLLLTFLTSMTFLLSSIFFCPSLRLFYLAPFLIALYYQKNFLVSLWGSFLCGLLLDLLSVGTHFGLYALNYTLTTFFLFVQRKNFFGDSFSTLPLMVFFFSTVSSFLQAIFLYLFEREIFFSWQWIISDLFLMPLFDASYAFVCFIVPFYLFEKPPRKGKEYFAK